MTLRPGASAGWKTNIFLKPPVSWRLIKPGGEVVSPRILALKSSFLLTRPQSLDALP